MNLMRIFFRAAVSSLWALLFMCLMYSTQLIELFPRRKTITVAAWSDILDPAVLAEFQKKTGVTINLSYFSSNEELLVKLKKTGGKGFDLIIPSDYAVKLLREQNLLKKIDKSKLTFLNDLNPVLLGHDYDPSNDYSIPLFWELFGVGIDEDAFTADQMRDPWQLIFNSALQELRPYTITMVNDPIEMVMLTSVYLFGQADQLDTEKLKLVEELLHKQKKFVKAYVDFRGDYFLATKNCAAIVSSSSYILRAQKQFPFIKFLVPGKTFVTIENCAISIGTQHEESVYALLNYLYQPESVVEHCEQFSFFPSTLSALPLLQGNDQQRELANMKSTDFSQLLFFKKQMDQIDLIRTWARVKS
jgi:spermidine/putrescine transport system substrate-binding protein